MSAGAAGKLARIDEWSLALAAAAQAATAARIAALRIGLLRVRNGNGQREHTGGEDRSNF